jgi:hypothetical protein
MSEIWQGYFISHSVYDQLIETKEKYAIPKGNFVCYLKMSYALSICPFILAFPYLMVQMIKYIHRIYWTISCTVTAAPF